MSTPGGPGPRARHADSIVIKTHWHVHLWTQSRLSRPVYTTSFEKVVWHAHPFSCVGACRSTREEVGQFDGAPFVTAQPGQKLRGNLCVYLCDNQQQQWYQQQQQQY